MKPRLFLLADVYCHAKVNIWGRAVNEASV